jgi:hypothetical protein
MITANWLRSILESPDRLGSIITRANWGIVAALFVGAVLTAFVIWAGSKRDVLIERLEHQKDQKLADTNRIAGEANERAGAANERAAKLEVTAEQAKLEQERVRHENLKLSEKVQQLTIEAERERAARVKLEPRIISQDQRIRLVPMLRQVANSIVRIRATNSSAESAQFAEQIRDVFLASGWQADPVFYNIIAGSPVEPGAVVIVQNNQSRLGVLVQQAFRSAGIELKGAIDPQSPADVVFLMIGQKP